jgi:hypothetical protein
MVLKEQIAGYDVGRVFMDAGSGINLIYLQNLQAMNISPEFLMPTDCSFHGIVLGSANVPLGSSTFALLPDKTLDERNRLLKSWTGHHNITRSSEDPRFSASWRFLIKPTLC